MKQIIIIVLILAAAGTVFYLTDTSRSTQVEAGVQTPVTYRSLSAGEAKEMMADGEEYVLLDVRTDEEYKEKRIDGAVLIPDYEIAGRVEQELPDRDARILIYCRSGRRSALAAQALIDLGYTNVYDFGGINDWPYDTVKE